MSSSISNGKPGPGDFSYPSLFTRNIICNVDGIHCSEFCGEKSSQYKYLNSQVLQKKSDFTYIDKDMFIIHVNNKALVCLEYLKCYSSNIIDNNINNYFELQCKDDYCRIKLKEPLEIGDNATFETKWSTCELSKRIINLSNYFDLDKW